MNVLHQHIKTVQLDSLIGWQHPGFAFSQLCFSIYEQGVEEGEQKPPMLTPLPSHANPPPSHRGRSDNAGADNCISTEDEDIHSMILLSAFCTRQTKEGLCCVFPFIYDERAHHSCITEDSSYEWCSTTETYDEDGDWGYTVQVWC